MVRIVLRPSSILWLNGMMPLAKARSIILRGFFIEDKRFPEG